MSETTEQVVSTDPKIMCFVCKRMVPKSEMVEVEYSAGKKVWVLAKYIRYNESED